MHNINRRDFIGSSLKASAAYTALPFLYNSESTNISKKLNILILGGTGFLGPHQVAYALARGHSVTTFTRGKSTPSIHAGIFDQVESLIGDREDDLSALEGRSWDIVIENSGYRSHWTEKSTKLLKGKVDLYIYTSSTGVYYPYLDSGIKEDQELVLEKPTNISEDQDLEYSYGIMKTESEDFVKKYFKKNHLVIRPTYMMGPGDKTDRFTYWPIRIAEGGQVLVPGKIEDPVQYIDVRDVAEWMIRLAEERTTGIYNAVGPISETSMQAFIYGVHAAFSSKCEFTVVDNYKFLKDHNILWAIPWIMPEGDNYGSARINFDLAVEHGLKYRPLAKSCQDIVEWWNSGIVDKDRMDRLLKGEDSLMTKETELLNLWGR